MKEKTEKLSYLLERVYDAWTNGSRERIAKEEADFWKNIFGEDFYERVLLNRTNIRHYLEKQPIRWLNLPDFVLDGVGLLEQTCGKQRLHVSDSEKFLSEWVDLVVTELYRRSRQYHLHKEFYMQAARDLETRLESVYIRILIAEMNILLEGRKLCGKDSYDKYQYFAQEYIRKPEFVHKVMSLYPGLYRAVLNELYQFFLFYQEFIQRYFTSKTKIRQVFGI